MNRAWKSALSWIPLGTFLKVLVPLRIDKYLCAGLQTITGLLLKWHFFYDVLAVPPAKGLLMPNLHITYIYLFYFNSQLVIKTSYTTCILGLTTTGIYSSAQVPVAAISHRVKVELPISTAKTLNTRFVCL